MAKPLVDMVLLIKEGRLHREKTMNALNKRFQRRKTHPLGMKVGQPPISWVLQAATGSGVGDESSDRS